MVVVQGGGQWSSQSIKIVGMMRTGEGQRRGWRREERREQASKTEDGVPLQSFLFLFLHEKEKQNKLEHEQRKHSPTWISSLTC